MRDKIETYNVLPSKNNVIYNVLSLFLNNKILLKNITKANEKTVLILNSERGEFIIEEY